MRAFNRDVATAVSHPFNHVHHVRRGDSEGEVVFSYSSDSLHSGLLIRILASNPDGYPSQSSFLVFTDSIGVSDDICKAMGAAQDRSKGKTVVEVISSISRRLSLAVAGLDGRPNEDVEMTDYEDKSDPETEDSDDYDYGDEADDDLDDFDGPGLGLSTGASRYVNEPVNSSVRDDITRQFRTARSAGCRVGKVTGATEIYPEDIFSVSIRVSKLGLSEDALGAWEIQPSDYLVLLIRIGEECPTLEDLISSRTQSPLFRLGRCARYKPSAESAISAFGSSQNRHHTVASDGGLEAAPSRAAGNFSPVFISRSIERFMNGEFSQLLFLRVRQSMSWELAMEKLRALQLQQPGLSQNGTVDYTSDSNAADKPHTINPVWQDHLTDDIEQKSVPLLAMQLAVLYFTRCTDFCMVCQKGVGGCEAVKPFVCDSPLCLYQYMSLGFGPTIEHEILTQPNVIDLLISFCYAAYLNHGHRSFPRGLSMKVPVCWSTPPVYPRESLPEPIPVRFNVGSRTMEVDYRTGHPLEDMRTTVEMNDRIRQGQYFLLVTPRDGSAVQKRIHCRVTNIQGSHIEFDSISSVVISPSAERTSDCLPFTKTETPATTEGENANGMAILYDTDFDDIPSELRVGTLLWLLESLPPVEDMTRYLTQHPGSPLSSYSAITPAAFTLLRWIVASNRSYIVHVGQTGKDSHPDLVSGLGPDWMQFRFAQGSLEKEQRFQKALQADALSASRYPTLFAWHGSALRSWHSIIRTGLDFNSMANGRAFGHGVYLSPDFQTSMGYTTSRQFVIAGNGHPSTWPGSKLRPQAAVALCELVNLPDQFRSKCPHYVIDKVDWVQCRYLFVRLIEAVEVGSEETSCRPDIRYLDLDPSMRLTGSSTTAAVRIPITAVPQSRRITSSGAPAGDYKTKVADATGTESEEEDDVDLELLSLKNHDTQSQMITTSYILDPSKTAFRPGTVDLTALPQLPPPSWASSGQKQVSREVSKLQKVQATTQLHELGWFIDFDKMDNMFQWIVELHSFDPRLPLATDMASHGITSIVLEVRFGKMYPMTPPFVRVIRPIFLPVQQGGGGHVMSGGSVCIELLTNSGWSPAYNMESVLVQIRALMGSTERPARLDGRRGDYGIYEALEAYKRALAVHGWKMPSDLVETAMLPYAQGTTPQ